MAVHIAWLTAMLTGTATNAPKHFPKSPSALLSKSEQKQPMNKTQWASMVSYILASTEDEPRKGNRPKYPARKD